MKTCSVIKLFAIFAVATIIVSCNNGAKDKETDDAATREANVERVRLEAEKLVAEEAEEAKNSKLKVYSSAYDGFLNIRSTASASSAIVGQFHNGEDEALFLELKDDWCKIELRDTVGYVKAMYLQQYPSQCVTSNVNAEWLKGVRKGAESTLLIFDNGTYLVYTHADFPYRSEVGFYMLEEDYITFERVALYDQQTNIEESRYHYSLDINAAKNVIGTYYSKERIWSSYEQRERSLGGDSSQASNGATWYYDLTWTVDEFEQESHWTWQQLQKLDPERFEIPYFLYEYGRLEEYTAQGAARVEKWLYNYTKYKYAGYDRKMHSARLKFVDNKFSLKTEEVTSTYSVIGSVSYDPYGDCGYVIILDDKAAESGVLSMHAVMINPYMDELQLIIDDETFEFSPIY